MIHHQVIYTMTVTITKRNIISKKITKINIITFLNFVVHRPKKIHSPI